MSANSCRIITAGRDFLSEIADIWVENMPNIEIAELTCESFQRICSGQIIPLDRFGRGVCADLRFPYYCPFADEKGDMAERPAGDFDQAVCAVLSGSYHKVRNAALLAIRKHAAQ